MPTVYAAPTVIGAGNGASWNDVAELQSAINIANPGDQIWAIGNNNVLGISGTYNLPNSLVINTPNLSIYGGFLGNETSLAMRNANINTLNPQYFLRPSILDGSALGGRSIVEVHAPNVTFDGFLIENGGSPQTPRGGGLNASSSYVDLIFENLVFRNNQAIDGGGMFLEDCRNNRLINLYFYQNSAVNRGGGLHLLNCPDHNGAVLVNLLFSENTANGQGSAIYMLDSEVRIINNTIVNNYTPNRDGVYAQQTHLEVYNSIILDGMITSPGITTIDYCLLTQAASGQNPNGLPIGTNPDFVNPNPPNANYHLQPSSLCIDAGNQGFVNPYTNTDLEGNPRVMRIEVDMGAFEMP